MSPYTYVHFHFVGSTTFTHIQQWNVTMRITQALHLKVQYVRILILKNAKINFFLF